MRQLTWLAAMLPFLAGCFAGGYAYPKLSLTPRLDTASPADEIFALRVDRRFVSGSSPGVGGYDHCEESFKSLGNVSVVRPQVGLGMERGWLVLVLPFAQHERVSFTTSVRLYRRGYQAVEVAAWSPGVKVHWRQADGVEGQAQAVEDLVRGMEREGAYEPGHRAVLLFAADEFERLGVYLRASACRERAKEAPADRPSGT